MKLVNKKILYELKIENFFNEDSKKSGNIQGIIAKLDYFKNLGINILAIDDILGQYQNNFELNEIKNKFGSIDDFIKLVKNFKDTDIEIAPIINLVNIKQSFINLNNMISLYNKEEKSNNLYLSKLDTYLLNKIEAKTSLYEIFNFVKYFKDILNFYLKIGINTIILDNFEFLAFEGLKEDKKIHFIADLYKIIKHKKAEMNVILKTSNANFNLYKKMLSSKTKSFDYLYLTYLSMIENKNKIKQIFNLKLNYNLVYKFIKIFGKYDRVIISLNSDLTGRFISKWCNEKAYFNEALKTLILFLYASNNSVAFYYGDEIGILRSQFDRNFDFNNENYNEEKRFYQSKNIDIEKFFLYNCYFNKLSSYTQMPWNSKKTKEKIGVKNLFYAINHARNNIENELTKKNNNLNFISFLNNFIFLSKYANFFLSNNLIIKHKKGIFIFKRKIKNKRLTILINLTNKHKKIIQLNDYIILNSSYLNKFYSELPRELGPFESLILLNKKANNN